ncbi:MAG: glycosyltransferase [Roseburia sp.]|nr:glycosyltransferase [Roseburia sp.]MCM1099027.1 glycosyltransferase [Ruminococcus flavefaciens]
MTDVIIPLYKPGKELFELLDRLRKQTVRVRKIILMNTEERYFRELTEGTGFAERYPEAEVHHLPKSEFDHGGTRRRAVEYSESDTFILMTQDAMPIDTHLIERLTERLTGSVAVAYGRQLPAPGSRETEKISRAFNYPEQSRVKGKADLEAMGIKAFFCSNVCAAYRRDIYDESGGFVRHTIFNEDMIYAAGVLQAGYEIAYAADARVIHSHNYTNRQQFRRNFDLGVSQAMHPEVFGGIASESEGKKLVGATWEALKKKGKRRCFPGFLVQCCCKYAGYLLGKHYDRLPETWVLACTDNEEFWRNHTESNTPAQAAEHQA